MRYGTTTRSGPSPRSISANGSTGHRDDVECPTAGIERTLRDPPVDVEAQPVGLVGIVAPLQHQTTRGGEGGDVVDVAVGVVVEGQTVRQPDHPLARRARLAGSASISTCVIVGLRFGCIRHWVVVTSVPSPSPVIEPPSNTMSIDRTG